MSNIIPLVLAFILSPALAWGSIAIAKWASNEEGKKYRYREPPQ